MVPATTPEPVIQKLSEALSKVILTESIRNQLGESAAQIKYLPHTEMAAFMKDEVARYKRTIDFAKIKVNE